MRVLRWSSLRASFCSLWLTSSVRFFFRASMSLVWIDFGLWTFKLSIEFLSYFLSFRSFYNSKFWRFLIASRSFCDNLCGLYKLWTLIRLFSMLSMLWLTLQSLPFDGTLKMSLFWLFSNSTAFLANALLKYCASRSTSSFEKYLLGPLKSRSI